MPTLTQLHLLFSQESKSDGESNSLPLQVSHTNYILELLCRMLLHDTSVQSDQLWGFYDKRYMKCAQRKIVNQYLQPLERLWNTKLRKRSSEKKTGIPNFEFRYKATNDSGSFKFLSHVKCWNWDLISHFPQHILFWYEDRSYPLWWSWQPSAFNFSL